MTKLPTTAGAGMALLFLAGCAGAGGPKSLTQGLDSELNATIEVRNGHNHGVEVFLTRADGGFPQRLGKLDPNANRGYRLPITLNGEPVRIVVQCLVTREIYQTQELAWGPESRLALSVGAHLPLTKLAQR